jgi:hypothetical protein
MSLPQRNWQTLSITHSVIGRLWIDRPDLAVTENDKSVQVTDCKYVAI